MGTSDILVVEGGMGGGGGNPAMDTHSIQGGGSNNTPRHVSC